MRPIPGEGPVDLPETEGPFKYVKSREPKLRKCMHCGEERVCVSKYQHSAFDEMHAECRAKVKAELKEDRRYSIQVRLELAGFTEKQAKALLEIFKYENSYGI